MASMVRVSVVALATLAVASCRPMVHDDERREPVQPGEGNRRADVAQPPPARAPSVEIANVGLGHFALRSTADIELLREAHIERRNDEGQWVPLGTWAEMTTNVDDPKSPYIPGIQG